MIKALWAVPVVLLVGCASQQEIETLAMYNTQSVIAQVQAQDKPTLSIKCIRGSCEGLDINFIHPSDRKRVISHRVRGRNDVITETLPSLTKMFTWAVGAWAASDIISSVSNASNGNTVNTSVTERNNTVNGDNNEQSTSRDGNDSSLSDYDNTPSSTISNNDSNDYYNEDNSTVAPEYNYTNQDYDYPITDSYNDTDNSLEQGLNDVREETE